MQENYHLWNIMWLDHCLKVEMDLAKNNTKGKKERIKAMKRF